MDRNGFATVFLLILIVADVSDASLLSNLRKFVLSTKDSLPGTSAPIPNSVTGENKLYQKPVKEENEEKNSDKKVGNGADNDSKLEQKPAPETSEKPKSDPESVNGANKGTKLDPEQVKETSKQKKSHPETVNETSKENKSDLEPVAEATKKKKSDPQQVNEATQEKKSNPEPVNEATKEKKPDTKPVKEATEEKTQDPKPVNKLDPKGGNEAGKEQTAPSPPSGNTEKKEDKSDLGLVTDDSCDGLNPNCYIQKDLIACIKTSDDGSKVIVQNKGESNLKANIYIENTLQRPEIPRKRSKLIPIPLPNGKGVANIVLSSGKNCVLPLSSAVSEANYYLRFPSYNKLVTPVNGAYLLIFTVLIFGGMWTCIKFSRRRRQGGGISYQELEMGLPESVSAVDVETAEGWDQGWDDDWDEDNAVKSPGGRHVGSISANGLTSRSPNKDGWEDNWDD